MSKSNAISTVDEIAKALEDAGHSHIEARSMAVQKVLDIIRKEPGTYDVHAGDTVFRLTWKGRKATE